ncbi:MAG: hypothetical protein M1596_02370 [Firmicutes bacterium]|nr:hypothetical protein [Bacillota bacterium]
MSGADVGTGAKRPSVDVALDSPKEDLFQADIEEGLKDFWDAVQWMRKAFESNITIHVLDSPGDQGFWVVNGKPRRVAAVQVLLPSGLIATVLEFARPDDYPISTLIVADILDQGAVKTLLPSLLFREGGWNCFALDQKWGSDYHLLRHLPRPPQRLAVLLLNWVQVLCRVS